METAVGLALLRGGALAAVAWWAEWAGAAEARAALLLLAAAAEAVAAAATRRRRGQKASAAWLALPWLSAGAAVFAARELSSVARGDGLRLAEYGGTVEPGFPVTASGDHRVIGAPRYGVVLSPYTSPDLSTVLHVALRQSFAAAADAPGGGFGAAGGPPTPSLDGYVTGDDFSTVIPIRNEEEFIVKTLVYTFENTPAANLREIIVVDDASDQPIEPLIDRDLPKKYRSKVRVFRMDRPQGLIRARIFGANRARASNILFLDGHCRPKPGWLAPLLRHLKANWRRIALPTIFDISRATWEDTGTFGAKMMFEWTFEFRWYDDLTSEVPLSSGGIFAITRRWWVESGRYDDGMMEWGGENLEQSLRVWLCGGEVFAATDSRVGHIFDRPEKPNPGNRLVRQVQRNQKRAALVWLDDYYKYFYHFHPETRELRVKDARLARRVELREGRTGLHCLPFQWYVNRFRTAFEREALLVDEYHPIVHGPSRFCLTASARPNDADSAALVLIPCLGTDNLNQLFAPVAGGRMLMNLGTKKCVDRGAASSYFASPETFIELRPCAWGEVFEGRGGEQLWIFDDGLAAGALAAAPAAAAPAAAAPAEGGGGRGDAETTAGAWGAADAAAGGGGKSAAETTGAPAEGGDSAAAAAEGGDSAAAAAEGTDDAAAAAEGGDSAAAAAEGGDSAAAAGGGSGGASGASWPISTSSGSGRIFSPPHGLPTLTGSDSVGPRRPAAGSLCLSSTLRFYELERTAHCAPELGNALEPVRVRLEPCRETARGGDIAHWDDDQRFMWEQ